MMNRRLGWMLLAWPLWASAGPDGYLRHGGGAVSSLSTGSTGLAAALANPAAGARLLGDERSIATGVLYLPHVGYEVGSVDNFAENFEDFEDRFDEVEAQIEQSEQSGDPNDAQAANDAIEALIQDFNPVLRDIVDRGYFNIELQQQLPVTPALFKALGGVWTLDVSADLKARIETVASTAGPGIVQGLDTDGDGLLDEVETNDLAALVTSGVFTQLGLGYSRVLPSAQWSAVPADMTLLAGARLNIIQGSLSKQLAIVDDDADDEEDTAFDRVEDNYDANEASTTALSLDVGLLAQWRRFSAGVTIFNLLPPSFDFGDFGQRCDRFDADSGQRADCEATQRLIDQGVVDEAGSYDVDTRLNIEGSYDIPRVGWTVGLTLDLNKVSSVLGDEYQWFEWVAGHDSGRWWLPDFAISYRQNLAGSEQSYLGVGMGLLRVLRLNISYGLDSTQVDGSDQPRSAAVSLGFEIPF